MNIGKPCFCTLSLCFAFVSWFPSKRPFENMPSRTQPRWVEGTRAPLVVKCSGGHSPGHRRQGWCERIQMAGGQSGWLGRDYPFLAWTFAPDSSTLLQEDRPILSYFRKFPSYTGSHQTVTNTGARQNALAATFRKPQFPEK